MSCFQAHLAPFSRMGGVISFLILLSPDSTDSECTTLPILAIGNCVETGSGFLDRRGMCRRIARARALQVSKLNDKSAAPGVAYADPARCNHPLELDWTLDRSLHAGAQPLFTESFIFFIEAMISSNAGAVAKIIGIVFS